MAVSLNSVVGFNSTIMCQHVPRAGIGASIPKTTHFTSSSGRVESRRPIKERSWGLRPLVANGDRVATETRDNGSRNAERSFPDEQSLAVNLPPLDSPTRDGQLQTSPESESGSQSPEVSNGSVVSSVMKQDASSTDIKSMPKRLPLTAREKLRAARLRSRYTESKASKSELGSRVLEALRESDKGKKRSGLPEAPTNLFDDSKRGMPKQGLTFEFPGGIDVFIIIFSFALISTLMFATTYIVWKVGAIHFNEY